MIKDNILELIANMKKKTSEEVREQNAITLMLLIIAVIILLILTGITVVTLTREKGLISKMNSERESTLNEIDVSETETIYRVNSIDGEIIKTTIKIKNDVGIAKIITPDGMEITPVTPKKQFAIDYTVTSGTDYIFKVQLKGSDALEDYILKANKDAKPQIKQNASYAYPRLSESGVEINKRVSIDFGDYEKNIIV